MKTINVSEATGPALNRLVAKCEGYEVMLFDDLWRANGAANGYDPVQVERQLSWQHQHGKFVIVELKNLQLDQRNPENLTPTRCGKYIPDYSTDWAQGGPIIERELIKISPYHNQGGWWAEHAIAKVVCDGPTPLIAAMRCYVASKLGDTVEVPKELL